MIAEKLISYLGYSIKSKELYGLMKQLNINTNPKRNLDVNGDSYNVISRDKLNEIILFFYGWNRYEWEFGEAKEVTNYKEGELILTGITFNSEEGNPNFEFSNELPFRLELYDEKQVLISKIGRKPREIVKTDYGHAIFFKTTEYSIIAAMNNLEQLIWLRILKLDRSEIESIKMRKELSSQRKNIDPKNVLEVKKLKNKLPTNNWKDRMREGDNLFTKENIKEIENILTEYLEKIVELTEAKKASSIFNSVKKVVKKINKVNEKNNYFIETLEREEICEFISELVITTGFKIKGDIDLTEEWRTW